MIELKSTRTLRVVEAKCRTKNFIMRDVGEGKKLEFPGLEIRKKGRSD